MSLQKTLDFLIRSFSFLASVLLVCHLLGLLGILSSNRDVIVSPIHIHGFAYSFDAVGLLPKNMLFEVRTQSEKSPSSGLRVFRNGAALGPSGVSVDRIAEVGGGAYSYWNGTVYFSENKAPFLLDEKPISLSLEYSWTLKSLIFWFCLIFCIPFIYRCFFAWKEKTSISTFNVLTTTLFLVTILLTFFDTLLGPWNHDSGYFLRRMFLISQGYKLYQDVVCIYAGLLLHIGAWFYKLGLSTYALIFLIPLMFKVINLFITGILIWRSTRNWAWVLLVSSFYLIFNIENQGTFFTLEHGVVTFSLIAFFLYQEQVGISWRWALPIGLAVGLAGISKQIGFVYGLPFFLPIFFGLEKRKFLAAASLLVGIFIAVCVFFYLEDFNFDGLYQAMVSIFLANMKFHNKYTWSFLYSEAFRSPLSWILWLLTIWILFIECFKSQKRELKAFYLSLLVVLAVLMTTRYARDFPHYSLNQWPIHALGLGLIIKRYSSSYFMRLMILAIPLLFLLNESGKIVNGISRWQEPSILFNLIFPVADRVQQLTQPGEKVLVLGEEEIIESLSQRLDPELRRIWDVPYKDINLSTEKIVLYDYGQAGALEKIEEIRNSGYQTVFEKSLYGAEMQPKIFIFSKAKNL